MNLQEREDVKTENFIAVINTCQIAINDLQLGSVMLGFLPPHTIMFPPANVSQHMRRRNIPLPINKCDNGHHYCQDGTSTHL